MMTKLKNLRKMTEHKLFDVSAAPMLLIVVGVPALMIVLVLILVLIAVRLIKRAKKSQEEPQALKPKGQDEP